MIEPSKEYWRGRPVSDYERRQRLRVPRKKEILETITDFMPFDGAAGALPGASTPRGKQREPLP